MERDCFDDVACRLGGEKCQCRASPLLGQRLGYRFGKDPTSLVLSADGPPDQSCTLLSLVGLNV